MINFNFQNPAKIIFGKGQIAKVAQEIKAFKARNVLIVAGGGSIKKMESMKLSCRRSKTPAYLGKKYGASSPIRGWTK